MGIARNQVGFLVSAALAVAGCETIDTNVFPDAAPEPGQQYAELITGAWNASPGTEPYWCVRVTVDDDMYITAFRALSPPGTHHSVLTVEPNPTEPDGVVECSPGTNERAMLFASGIGTDDFEFPPGIAVEVDRGSQLLLNLHIFNVSDTLINGISGTLVKTVPRDDVVELAEMVFAGTRDISIPANPTPVTASGRCTFTRQARILNIWPHMHQVGDRMRVSHGPLMLHDEPYDFNEQVNHPLAAPGHIIDPGETLDVECTYVNTGSRSITYGDSSTDEMCYAGFYRYPAAGDGLFCLD